MWKTVGHDRAVTLLRRGLEIGRTSHAYLVSGPARVGKMTLALDLTAALNCADPGRPCGECGQCVRIARGLHADVRVIGAGSPRGEQGRPRLSIGIDQVREVRREANLRPFEGSFRVLIFDGVERLTDEAANSILKLLEEPPDRVVLILLSSDASAVPSTIASRCQLLELRPLPLQTVAEVLRDEHGADRDTADEIARRSGGRLGWALEAVERREILTDLSERFEALTDVIKAGLEARFAYAESLASSFFRSRDTVWEELRMWLDLWRDLLLMKEGGDDYVVNLPLADQLSLMAESMATADIVAAVGCVRETWLHLERNVNPRLALEEMMLRLPRPVEAAPAVSADRV